MSMDTAAATVFIRSLIKEATAKFWTAAEITAYLNSAMSEVWGKYSHWLYEAKKSWEDIDIESGESDYDVPDDCYKISKILLKSNGYKIRYVSEDELFKYTDLNPSSDSNAFFTVYYLPKYTDISSFPDCLQPLACVIAAIYAKTKDEDVTADLLELRNWHEQVAVVDMAMYTMNQVEAFADFTEEDTCDSRYAWTYKAGQIHFLANTTDSDV